MIIRDVSSVLSCRAAAARSLRDLRRKGWRIHTSIKGHRWVAIDIDAMPLVLRVTISL